MIWQIYSRLDHFWCEIRIRHEILHRHGAPGLDQAIPDSKIRVISLRLFHRLVFYIFWKKTTPMGPLQGHLKSWRQVGFTWFFLNHIKNTSPSLWARLFDPGGPTSHRTSIEQVLWRKNCSNSWVWPAHLISDSELSIALCFVVVWAKLLFSWAAVRSLWFWK